MQIDIDTAPFNDESKALLRKLAAAGFKKAGVEYVLEPELASANEFQEILQSTFKGGLPVFESFHAPNAG